MKEAEVIVLAGGFGSRMGKLTEDTQKCLLPFHGTPILGHILENLSSALTCFDLKVAVGYKGDQVKAFVDKFKTGKIDISYVFQPAGLEGWGTYLGMDGSIKGTFLATPGDVIVPPEVYREAITVFRSTGSRATLTLAKEAKTAESHGVGRVQDSEVVNLQWPSSKTLDNDQARDMTIWCSDSRIFNEFRKFPAPKKSIGYFFMEAIENGLPASGWLYEGKWTHFAEPKDLEAAAA